MKHLLALLLLATTSSAVASEIDWRPDFEAALGEAVLERKPLFITFYTDWCGWCRKLERTTFKDVDFSERLEKYYVPVRLNADQQRGLAAMMQVKVYPTTVLLTRQAKEIGRITGYQGPKDFARILLVGLQRRETTYDKVEKRITKAPHDPVALYAWGDVLLALNRYGEARLAFEQVLHSPLENSAPLKADANLDLAISIWRAEGAQAALDTFQSFLDRYPTSGRRNQGFLFYGKALLEAGHRLQGIRMLAQAAEHAQEEYVRAEALKLGTRR